MKKTIIVAIGAFMIWAVFANIDIYSAARKLPTTPAEVLKYANEDVHKLYGIEKYFPENSKMGPYRKDLLTKRIAKNDTRYYEIVYGKSHGAELDGGMLEYAGYTVNGEHVPTENVPWFAGWSGTQIQNFKLYPKPWDNGLIIKKYGISKNDFNQMKITNNTNFTKYLPDGTFEQLIIKGMNIKYGGKHTYKEFMYRNQNAAIAGKPVYTDGATPKQGGRWIDYVHVLQPPTYFSWGYGTVYIVHDDKSITYLDIPIAPMVLLEQDYDLQAAFDTLPLQAQAGEKVEVKIRVHSTFPEQTQAHYKWDIIQASTDEAIPAAESKLKFTGHAVKAEGELVIPKNGEQLLVASFIMPDSEVRVKFNVNSDGKTPKEKVITNNVLDSSPIAVKLLKPQPLTYNVLTRKVKFPIYGGAELVAQLTKPRGTWVGNATGELNVLNGTLDLFRNYKVLNNEAVNEPGTRISRQPIVSATIDRKDFGDDPQNGKWLNVEEPDTPKVREGSVDFRGAVQRTYEYELKNCNKDKCTTRTVTETAHADFPQGTDRKLYEMYFYHGRKNVPDPIVEKKIEKNNNTSLAKRLLWRTEPYPFDVIRWMYHMDENNKAYQAVAVDGQYERSFTQQGVGEVTWSTESSQAKEYQVARTAAKEGQASKTLYDKAVFATDRELQQFNYPVKSGYYFNPAGSYSFNVKTVVYKPVKDDTEDHKELVQKVIDSFRYESDLIYINNKKIAVNLSNEELSKQGGGFARKRGVLTAEKPKGVNGEVLLAVLDRSVDSSRYSKQVVELKHSQNTDGDTHDHWKKVMEGYSQSSTAGSNSKFEYKEFVKDGQLMYEITEQTKVTIVINPKNSYLYTHANMGDGQYTIRVSIGDVDLSKSKLAYNVLQPLRGIAALDGMTVTVKGSMYDDLFN
ncbi:hypothetical protein J7E73_29520 [Paenibacillus albidus]|uniref:hypothetical protein n=1 Tax=Paenibacillus albidus TaxID=2041023 RepID=UPI001BED01C1|nr:hypothetical protein [Paenibacillus albidus]MBT2293175.1 hypothetical protein [Paenibacillus albidus]